MIPFFIGVFDVGAKNGVQVFRGRAVPGFPIVETYDSDVIGLKSFGGVEGEEGVSGFGGEVIVFFKEEVVMLRARLEAGEDEERLIVDLVFYVFINFCGLHRFVGDFEDGDFMRGRDLWSNFFLVGREVVGGLHDMALRAVVVFQIVFLHVGEESVEVLDEVG